MKLTVLLNSLFFSLCSLAQTHMGKYNLPGFVQLNDSVYISKCEVSIRDYASFLSIARKEGSDKNFYEKNLPEPNFTNWTIWSTYSKALITFNNSIYDLTTYNLKDTGVYFNATMSNWPIVNITKEQISQYCEFRIKDYKIFYDNLKKRRKIKFPTTLYFRLPTESEWILAANNEVDGNKPLSKDSYKNDTLHQLHPISCFRATENKIGLFNITGNVAEFVSDSEFVFGGSYIESEANCKPLSKRKATNDNSVGFRVVAVVH